MGLSARALSLKLDLSTNAWHYYEAGQKEPSLNTLSKLAALGVDLNWLATGEGTPLRLPPNPPAQPPAPTLPRRLRDVVSALKTVIEDSEAKNLNSWASILEHLAETAEGLDLKALAERLHLSDLALLRDNLLLLMQEGLVVESKGVYRLVRLSLVHRSQEAELRTLLGVRDLLNVILPLAQNHPKQAVMLMVEMQAAAGAGREVLRELKRMTESWHAKYAVHPLNGSGEHIYLVLSGAFTPCN